MTFLAALRNAWWTLSDNFSGVSARNYRQLSKLDERLLDDIGISLRQAQELDEKMKCKNHEANLKTERNT